MITKRHLGLCDNGTPKESIFETSFSLSKCVIRRVYSIFRQTHFLKIAVGFSQCKKSLAFLCAFCLDCDFIRHLSDERPALIDRLGCLDTLRRFQHPKHVERWGWVQIETLLGPTNSDLCFLAYFPSLFFLGYQILIYKRMGLSCLNTGPLNLCCLHFSIWYALPTGFV